MSDCIPCVAVDCGFPSDLELYSLDGLQFFLNGKYHFVLDCPPGYTCYNFPVPWEIESGVLPPIYLPPNPGDGPYTLRIKCCNHDVVGNVPANATPAQVSAIVQLMFKQCALFQAQCEAVATLPVVPDPPPNVNPRAVFRFSALLSSACMSSSYVGTFSVVTGFPAATISILSGTLPPGLTFSQITAKGAAISGTPTTPGNYTFTVIASSGAFSDQKTYTIKVLGITNANTLPGAIVGDPYAQTLTGGGGTGPYTFDADPAEMPDWLSMDAAGNLTGTPDSTDAGITFNFSPTITDSIGQTCEVPCSIDVAEVGFIICAWDCVRGQLTMPSGPDTCAASAQPAWDGKFNLEIDDAFDSSPIWYFIDGSINGVKASANESPTYGDPGWQDVLTYSQIWYDPGLDTWHLSLLCVSNSFAIWSGSKVGGGASDPTGVYTGATVGDTPQQISVVAIGDTASCPQVCPDWSNLPSPYSSLEIGFGGLPGTATVTPDNAVGSPVDLDIVVPASIDTGALAAQQVVFSAYGGECDINVHVVFAKSGADVANIQGSLSVLIDGFAHDLLNFQTDVAGTYDFPLSLGVCSTVEVLASLGLAIGGAASSGGASHVTITITNV